jgi:hypothetical protein
MVDLPAISDDDMRSMLPTAKAFSVVLLQAGPRYGTEGADKILWEHGRRNFALRAAGLLSVVCPVPDDSPLCGVGIFDLTVEEATEVMDGDPGVQAGVFTYEVHPCRSFPHDALPG